MKLRNEHVTMIGVGITGIVGIVAILHYRNAQTDAQAQQAMQSPLFQTSAIPQQSDPNAAGASTGISLSDLGGLFSSLTSALTAQLPGTTPTPIDGGTAISSTPNFGSELILAWDQMVQQAIASSQPVNSLKGGGKGASGQLGPVISGAMTFTPDLATGGGTISTIIGPGAPLTTNIPPPAGYTSPVTLTPTTKNKKGGGGGVTAWV